MRSRVVIFCVAFAAGVAVATAAVAVGATDGRRIPLRLGDFVSAGTTQWACSLNFDNLKARQRLSCSSGGARRSLFVQMERGTIQVDRCNSDCSKSKTILTARE